MALEQILGQRLGPALGKSEDRHPCLTGKQLAIRHELPMVHCNLGNALTQIGDYENGILAFTKRSPFAQLSRRLIQFGVALRIWASSDAAMETLNRCN